MNLKGKNILVTGSEGFIGSHLAEKLLDHGCKLRCFVMYNSFNSWGWLESIEKEKLDQMEIFMGDIRDPNGVRKALQGIDIVFHLAALIGIPYSYYSPDSYIDTNIKGTLNVLQAARDLGISKILITSTSEVYGTAKYIPIDETHPFQGQSPYSATKIGADRLAESFYRSFSMPISIVRPFNTYGPRQSARAIIPSIITQLLSGSREIKVGSLHPTRDFVYVDDTVLGFIEIAKSDKTIGEEINIATNTEISINNLITVICNSLNVEIKIIQDKNRMRPQSSEVERLVGSNQKLKKLTNWHLNYNFDQGIKETIEWFKIKKNLKRYKQNIYNV